MNDFPIGSSLKKRHARSIERHAFHYHYHDQTNLAWPWKEDDYDMISKDGCKWNSRIQRQRRSNSVRGRISVKQ